MEFCTKDVVSELIARRGKDLPSNAAAERMVRTIFDIIADQLVAGCSVRVAQFGTFHTIQSKARVARNPATGSTVQVPEKRRARFRASQDLHWRLRLSDDDLELPGEEEDEETATEEDAG